MWSSTTTFSEHSFVSQLTYGFPGAQNSLPHRHLCAGGSNVASGDRDQAHDLDWGLQSHTPGRQAHPLG